MGIRELCPILFGTTAHSVAKGRFEVTAISGALAHSVLTSSWETELECKPASASHARSLVRSMLTTWGYPEAVVDDAGLLISELATNAFVHGRSEGCEHFGIGLTSAEEWLILAVSDSSSKMPLRGDAAADHESGRGLALVEALGAHWGAAVCAGGGKVVWVALDAPLSATTDGHARHADEPAPGSRWSPALQTALALSTAAA